MDNPAATAQQALESLIDAARRLGATQAKKRVWLLHERGRAP